MKEENICLKQIKDHIITRVNGWSINIYDLTYGTSIFMEKQECTSHITKRLGTGLRALVKSCKGQRLSDGKGIGGKGRQTAKHIDTFPNFYGAAIRSNK